MESVTVAKGRVLGGAVGADLMKRRRVMPEVGFFFVLGKWAKLPA